MEIVGNFNEIDVVRRIRVGRHVLVSGRNISRVRACQHAALRVVSQLRYMAVLIRDRLGLARGVKVGIGEVLCIGIPDLRDNPLTTYKSVTVRGAGKPRLEILILVAVRAASPSSAIKIFLLKS